MQGCTIFYHGCGAYEYMMLEFLITLSHNVGLMPNTYEEEQVTFCLLDQDFNITFEEGCNHFGFPNNHDEIHYVYEFTNPHPRKSFYQMSVHGSRQRASCIESLIVHYFYYVITNSLQA